MKSILLLNLFLTINYLSFSQDVKREYIESFNRVDTSVLIDFLETINSQGKLMTKQEALDYVYHGDSSRLYCIHEILNMETEKRSGITREFKLPRKYFFIELKNCYLIASSSYLCKDLNKLAQVSLVLEVISKNLILKDTLEIYRGNEYNYEFAGMINPINGKVFITGFNKIVKRYARLLELNQDELRFKIIREKNNADISSENWKSEVEKLGWYDEFMK